MVQDFEYPFTSTVEAKADDVVTIHVKRLFRGQELIVDDDCASFFSIVTVKVGERNQRPDLAAATSAIFFSHNALGAGVKWDTASPGVPITILVRNETDHQHRFSGKIKGVEAA